MNRTPLKQGDTIVLNKRACTIEEKLGDGATCIVYSAYYLDSVGMKHPVRIKECYPYRAGITRDGHGLLWVEPEEQQKALDAFQLAYEKLMHWQNENFAVNVFDLCEANNTLYIVMNADKGETFSKNRGESLHEILKTVKLLTHFVGKYHENGYLHLDIKPDNFLVYPRPSEHIVLFDMDSETPIADVQNGTASCVSYSDGWAAPEQKQGKITKLCPATDVFAIGAILFEKVMGRKANAEDMGVFADWDFDGELFDDVNPKIKRLLRTIFQKTLAANIKRRYQTAAELSKELEKAISLTSDAPFLQTESICGTSHFVGRELELLEIHRAFSEKNRMVFLQGFRGMGKSELARMYAQRYSQDYDVILFVEYGRLYDSITSWMEDAPIQNFDESGLQKIRKLKSLLDDKTLIIIDNFDIRPGEDNGLTELLKTKAKILVTTTTNFSDLYTNNAYHISVGTLSFESLAELFVAHLGHPIHAEELPLLERLLAKIEYHTYFAELLARQMNCSGISLSALLLRVDSGLVAANDPTNVITNKDGELHENTLSNIMRTLFSLSNLTEAQAQVLRNMCLLNFVRMTKAAYKEFAYNSDFNDFNSLVRLGYIQENGEYFTIHSLLEDLIRTDMKPDADNCLAVYDAINSRIRYCCDFDDYGDAAKERYDQACDFLCAFFCNVSFDAGNNRELLLNWLMGIIENEYTELGSPVYSRFRALYEYLANLISDKKTTPKETLKMRYIILEAWVREFGTIYCGDPDYNEKMEQLRQEKLKDAFRQAVDATLFLGISEREKALDHIYELLFNASWLFSIHKMPPDFVQQLYRERPQACTLSAREKKDRGLPLTAEELAEIEKFYEENPVFAPDYTDADIDEEQKCKQEFRDAEDKIAFIEGIINNKEIPAFKRAELVWHCTDLIFMPLHMEVPPAWFHKDTIDWLLMESILSIEEDFLISDEINCESHDEHEDWAMYLSLNTVNQIIVSAALGEMGDYEANMNILLDDIGHDVNWHLKHNGDWSQHVCLRSFGNAPLWYVLNGISQIGKSSWILPYLLRYANGWEAYAQKKKLSDREPLFPVYKAIVECADNACLESDIPAQFQLDYHDISVHYQGCMDEITGKTYTLRPQEE